jgi:peptide/nickel transport system substrate-binding protein
VVGTQDPARGWGGSNRSGFSNAGLDRLVDRALATLDAGEREGLYREATRMAIAERPILPLHHQVNIWAARRGLAYEGRSDERTMAMSLRPASR